MEKTYAVRHDEESYLLNFSSFNTSIAVGVTLDNYTRVDESLENELFDVTLSSVKFSKTNNTKIKQDIMLVPCQPENFHPDVRNNFQLLGLGHLKCAENIKLVNAKGGEFEDYWEYTEWTVKIKDTLIANPTKLKEWLDKYPMKFIIYYPEVVFDHTNLTNPVHQVLQSKYFHLYYDLYKKEIFEISKFEFQTNDQLTKDEYKIQTYLTLNRLVSDAYGMNRPFSKINENSNYRNLVRIYINSSRTTYIVQRRMGKLIDFLTIIQFFTILIMIVQTVAVKINHYYLRRKIMKSIIKTRNPEFYNEFIDKIEYYYTPEESDTNKIEAEVININNKKETDDRLPIVKRNLTNILLSSNKVSLELNTLRKQSYEKSQILDLFLNRKKSTSKVNSRE